MDDKTKEFIAFVLGEVCNLNDEDWREYRKSMSELMISRTDLVEISQFGDPDSRNHARVRILAKTAIYKSRDQARLARREIYKSNSNFGRF